MALRSSHICCVAQQGSTRVNREQGKQCVCVCVRATPLVRHAPHSVRSIVVPSSVAAYRSIIEEGILLSALSRELPQRYYIICIY